MSSLPCIVLVGRPNVGKSTLFNRLIRSNRAITHDRPGVTRDRMEGVVRRKGHPDFGIVDTGGITLDAHAMVTEGPEGIRGFESDILRQAEAAMKDACAVAFVVDGRDGLLPLDEYLAAHIRRMGLPTLCVVNKVDGLEKEDELLAEFHSLGFPLLPVSAEHGHNIRALTEELADLLPDDYEAEHEPPALRLAMLGRPNAGKSSMINALGTIPLAAHSIANTVESAFYIPGYGMQTAAATLIGNALGARDERLMRRLARMLVGIEMVLMVVSGGLLFIFAPGMMSLFTIDAAVIALGATVLRMVAVSEPFFGVAIILEGMLQGTGNTMAPFVFNIIGMWGVRILGTFVCTRLLHMGLVAAWACMIAHNLLLFLLLLTYCLRGRWNPLTRG